MANKKIPSNYLRALAAVPIAILIGAFLAFDLNPGKWSGEMRWVTLFIYVVVLIILYRKEMDDVD